LKHQSEQYQYIVIVEYKMEEELLGYDGCHDLLFEMYLENKEKENANQRTNTTNRGNFRQKTQTVQVRKMSRYPNQHNANYKPH